MISDFLDPRWSEFDRPWRCSSCNELHQGLFDLAIFAPVFWAGPRSKARLEFTQTTDGRTYVRYLTGSAQAGVRRADYIAVATYPQPDAYNRATAAATPRR